MYNNVPGSSFDAKRLSISIHITKIHILILKYFRLYEKTLRTFLFLVIIQIKQYFNEKLRHI